MTNDLKHCPFCGSEARIYFIRKYERRTEDEYYIACTNHKCGCKYKNSRPLKTKEELTEEWNRRINND